MAITFSLYSGIRYYTAAIGAVNQLKVSGFTGEASQFDEGAEMTDSRFARLAELDQAKILSLLPERGGVTDEGPRSG